MPEPHRVFDDALDWLRAEYSGFTFFVERDLVWTLQTHLLAIMASAPGAITVVNDLTVHRSGRHRVSVDLAFVSSDGTVLLGAEFKYEPSHIRTDIPAGKFPVVPWTNDGVGKDVERVRDLVSSGTLKTGYALFIDEGGYYRAREPHPAAVWQDWENGVSLHRAIFTATDMAA